MLYAHIETRDDGTKYAIDVHDFASVDDYRQWAANIPGSADWVVETVPDGTVAGAHWDGTQWVNPVIPTPAPAPSPGPTPTKTDLQNQIAALTAQLAALP